MSRHIRIHGRPLHVDDPGQQPPPLSLSGDFPNYRPGTDYEGRIDIIDSIGMCSVELISGDLPRDYHLYVDQVAKQVVLVWPGFTEVEPVAQIPNGDFQQGPGGWELPAGWAVESYEKPDITPTPAPGNLAAVCRALGRGDHAMQSVKYPCPPGTIVQASGLWDQGPSNKDNVNLFTALAFYDESGNEILESRGNRIHDETNKQRHTSTVSATAPAGTDSVALRNIVHRRNRRNREVIVDDCSWTLTFMSDVASGEYCFSIRVRDSAARFAVWSGCVDGVAEHPYVEKIEELSPVRWFMLNDPVESSPAISSPAVDYGTLPSNGYYPTSAGLESPPIISDGRTSNSLEGYEKRAVWSPNDGANLSRNFTVKILLRCDDVGTNQHICNVGRDGWGLIMWDGMIRLDRVWDAPVVSAPIMGNIVQGDPFELAVTVSSGASATCKLFINGLLIAQASTTKVFDAMDHPASGLCVGSYTITETGGDRNQFIGQQQHFQFYDREMSESEILEHAVLAGF